MQNIEQPKGRFGLKLEEARRDANAIKEAPAQPDSKKIRAICQKVIDDVKYT